jgi:hypothetical protein
MALVAMGVLTRRSATRVVGKRFINLSIVAEKAILWKMPSLDIVV